MFIFLSAKKVETYDVRSTFLKNTQMVHRETQFPIKNFSINFHDFLLIVLIDEKVIKWRFHEKKTKPVIVKVVVVHNLVAKWHFHEKKLFV